MHVPYVVKKRYGSQTVADSVPVKAVSASGLFCISYYHVDCIYCTLDKKRHPCGHCAECKASGNIRLCMLGFSLLCLSIHYSARNNSHPLAIFQPISAFG